MSIKEENLALLLGGASAGLLAAMVQMGGGVGFSQAIGPAMFGVGMPTAVAGLAASYVEGIHDSDTMTAIVVGTTSVGIMMVLGELPMTVDFETIVLIGVCAAGSYMGNYLAHWSAHGDTKK
jgi:hypothetical protein